MLNINIRIFISFGHTVSSNKIYAADLVNLGTWDTLFSKLNAFQGKNAGFAWFDFYCIGLWLYILFNCYLDFEAQNTFTKLASS